MANKLAYIDYVPVKEAEAFAIKLIAVAKALKTDPNYLMQVMYSESRVRPDALNTYYPFKKRDGSLDGYATGLIQFTPATARSLGTTTQALAKMSRVQQLDYVQKYYERLGLTGKLNSYYDVYLATFFPVGIGKPDSWVFETKNIARTEVAKANPAIDINKDGKITMAEFKQYVLNSVPSPLRNTTTGIIAFLDENKGKIASTLVGAFFLAF